MRELTAFTIKRLYDVMAQQGNDEVAGLSPEKINMLTTV